MINKRTLYNIRRESGLDYNDKDQIESALIMANFAMHELEENSCKNKNEVLLSLYKNTSLLKELLSDGVMKAKYMNDVIALKIRMKELEAKEKIENFKIDAFSKYNDECYDFVATYNCKNEEDESCFYRGEAIGEKDEFGYKYNGSVKIDNNFKITFEISYRY